MFESESIPTASFLDIFSIHQPNTEPFTIPTQNHFNEKMKEYGITKEDTAVFYSQKNVIGSYRMWYLMTSFGHPHSLILDGNLKEWEEKGFEISNNNLSESKPSVADGDLSYTKDSLKLECQLDDVIQAVKTKSGIIIDTRVSEIYNADPIPPRKLSHIPGAISLPYKDLLGGNQKVFSLPRLHHILTRKKIDLSKKMIVYCNKGIVATVCFAVLSHLGADVKLYNGSWAEYSSSERTLELE